MNNTVSSDHSTPQVEQVLGDTLAQEEAMLASARPVLKHLLSGNAHTLLSEHVVARVNAMLGDVARQLLFAVANAGEMADPDSFADAKQADLAAVLSSDTGMLAHLHALASEGLATSKMQQEGHCDAVLSPFLQDLAGSKDEAVAAGAMGVVAAQARFVQQQNRMELPLLELQGDQFHTCLLALAEVAGDNLAALDTAVRTLRRTYDEAETRLGRITQLLMRAGDEDSGQDEAVLSLEKMGVAIFSTVIGLASGQDRSRIIMALSGGAGLAICSLS